MKKSFVVLFHIGFWLCYFMMIVIVVGVYYRSGMYASGRETRVLNAYENISLFAFIPSVISYFIYFYWLFPRYLQQRKILLSIIYGILISLCAAVGAYILHRYLIETGHVIDIDEAGKNSRSKFVLIILVSTVIGIICGVVALVINGFITWFNEIKLKERLREKNHEMEMALVKSQLDPHLLFNTINNIDALILRDAVMASEYLNKLSDIMRFILYETKADKIFLFKEIEYIEKYIALQKIRTANEDYVRFSVIGTVGKRTIAPMVIIPFIENAFKHTNNKKIKNAISVSIIIRDKNIEMVCVNKFDSKLAVQETYSGLGNELIRKRLELIYAGKHYLEVKRTDEMYSVNLTIPNG